MVLNTKQEAISAIIESLHGCINRMENELYSVPVIDILARLKMHDSPKVAAGYPMLIQAARALSSVAADQLNKWAVSSSSFIGMTQEYHVCDESCYARLKAVDTGIICAYGNFGLCFDDLVSEYVAKHALRCSSSRKNMLSDIRNVKQVIYNYKVDYTDRIKLSAATVNSLYACILQPIDIIFELCAQLLAVIATVLNKDDMPDIYEGRMEMPAIASPTIVIHSIEKPNLNKTGVFGADGKIRIQSRLATVTQFLTMHESELNALSAKDFDTLMQRLYSDFGL